VALQIHNSIQHTTLNIPDDHEALAIHIQSKLNLNVFSTYISPNIAFTSQSLQNTLITKQTPSLLTGDFNGWHPSWGPPRKNPRGKIIQRLIDNTQLIILNDKSPTHFSTYNAYT